MFAERLKGHDDEASAAVAERGQASVLAALALCQLIYDYGGTVANRLAPPNAVLNADRVAEPTWTADTLRRLHERVGQLRAAGEPGLASWQRAGSSPRSRGAPPPLRLDPPTGRSPTRNRHDALHWGSLT